MSDPVLLTETVGQRYAARHAKTDVTDFSCADKGLKASSAS
jgi:hypothetical protein